MAPINARTNSSRDAAPTARDLLSCHRTHNSSSVALLIEGTVDTAPLCRRRDFHRFERDCLRLQRQVLLRRRARWNLNIRDGSRAESNQRRTHRHAPRWNVVHDESTIQAGNCTNTRPDDLNCHGRQAFASRGIEDTAYNPSGSRRWLLRRNRSRPKCNKEDQPYS
jgi:hypothetical protein